MWSRDRYSAVGNGVGAEPTNGNFQTVVSYVSVPVTSGATTTYSLKRLSCVNGSTTPSNVSTWPTTFPPPPLIWSHQSGRAVVCETGLRHRTAATQPAVDSEFCVGGGDLHGDTQRDGAHDLL